MKRLTVLALAALLAAPAMAVNCTSQSIWTGLGPPGSVNFGGAFANPGSYVDCYTFTLSSAAGSSGTTAENNLLFDKLYIDVTSVKLFSGGLTGLSTSDTLVGYDGSPNKFSFNSLAGGTYTMSIASTVGTNWFSLYTAPVSYTGNFTTVASTSVASPAPEGDASLMAIVGVLGVGGAAAARRRRA